MTKTLRTRIVQHLVRRDSSVSTGAAAVGLNADYVTSVAWWEDERFSDLVVLEAAELVAFEVLQPILRSRGGISESARALSNDPTFRERMADQLQKSVSGTLRIPTLGDALVKLEQLEARISKLESLLARGGG